MVTRAQSEQVLVLQVLGLQVLGLQVLGLQVWVFRFWLCRFGSAGFGVSVCEILQGFRVFDGCGGTVVFVP